MATTSISARPEQTDSSIYPLAARAARKAVRQWFDGKPTQTIVQCRETCRAAHCIDVDDVAGHSAAFDSAYALEVGRVIAGGRSND